MLGESEDPLRLKGEMFDEDTMLPRYEENKDATGVVQYYIIKQFLAYLAEEYEQGLEFSEKAEPMYQEDIS